MPCAAGARNGRLRTVSESDGDRERRLAFAIPPIVASSDCAPELLDPADPDDRALLIRAAHPELDARRDTVVVGGREINLRLHLTMHEIVAARLADHDPPEVWATAQRLRALGYDRHEILHMLAAPMTGQV